MKGGRWLERSGSKTDKYHRGTVEQMQLLAQKYHGKCLSLSYRNQYVKLQWECAAGHRWSAIPINIKQGQWCPICHPRLKGDHSIEELQRIAQNQGGKCLASKYADYVTLMEWECAAGHRWYMLPRTILKGSWCPRCRHINKPKKPGRKHSLEEMQQYAKNRDGTCLSKEYRTIEDQVFWRCNRGHEWQMTFSAIMEGAWCPQCDVHARQYTLQDLQIIAASFGGKCLAPIYHHYRAKIEWVCNANHHWFMPLEAVKRGHWCRKCAKKAREIGNTTSD